MRRGGSHDPSPCPSPRKRGEQTRENPRPAKRGEGGAQGRVRGAPDRHQNPPDMYFHCTILSLISRRRRLIMRQRRLRNCSEALGSLSRISLTVALSIGT